MRAAALDPEPEPRSVLAHRLVVGLLVLAFALGVQRYAELVYWERENARIDALPPEQRDAERKRALVAFNREVDANLETWVQKCVASGNDKQAECMIAAKTRADALRCAEIDKGEGGGCCEIGGGAPASSAALAALVALALGRRRRRRGA
jgi:MYXO-CTERM domain-containing protein